MASKKKGGYEVTHESSDLLEFLKHQERTRQQEQEDRDREKQEQEKIRQQEREERDRQREEQERIRREEEKSERAQEQEFQERKFELLQTNFAQLLKTQMEQTAELLRLSMEKDERTRSETAAERKEDKRKEAIPKIAAMTKETEISEYLEMFEENMGRKEIPRCEWCGHLTPLMNDECRSITSHMEPEDKLEYKKLKEELINASSSSSRRAGESFWTLERKKGQNFSQVARNLTRLIHRFAEKDTVKESLDQVVTEKLLQMLPKSAATSIREKEPKSSKEAARLAEYYFQDRNMDLDDPRWLKRADSRDFRRGMGEPFQRHHRERFDKGRRYGDDRPSQEKIADHPRKERGDLIKKEDGDKRSDNQNEKRLTDGKPQRKRGPQCFECQGWGHMRDKCPSRVLFVHLPRKPKGAGREPWSIRGKINGTPVENMILDTGAAITVVSEEMLPPNTKNGRTVQLRGLKPDITEFDLADIQLELGDGKLSLEVAVAPSGTLTYPVLIGRDVPGMELTMKLTSPPQEILPVMTRSAARKEREQQEADDKASEESGATPLAVDDLPDLPVEDEDADEDPGAGESDQDDTGAQEEVEHNDINRGNGWCPTDLDEIADDVCRDVKETTTAAEANITREDLIIQQQEDPALQPLIAEARSSINPQFHIRDGLLLRKAHTELGDPRDLIVIPKKLRHYLFHIAHTHALAGHLGKKRTADKVARHFYWPNLGQDIQQWCKECVSCQKGNRSRQTRAPLMPLPTVDEPWKRIAIDIVGPLQRTKKGHKYLLTVMDFATRFPEAIALKRIDAPTICEELLQIFSRYGLPKELLSDRGTNFTAKLTEELLKKLNIKHLKASPYHPQSNGMLERFHGVLKQMLRKTCDQPTQWDVWLPFVLFAYRESIHASTGFSPFELMFGRDIRGPLAILKETWVMDKKLPPSIIEFILQTREKFQQTSQLVKVQEQRSKQDRKKWYDKKSRDDPLKIGEDVMVLLPEESAGAFARWHGPFTILERPTPLTYIISTPARGRKTRTFHRNLLKRFIKPAAEIMQVIVAEEETGEQDQLDIVHPPTIETSCQEWTPECNHLSNQQTADLQKILQDFQDVFNDTPGTTKTAEHVIPTGDAIPISQPPYRIPLKWKQQMAEEEKQLLDNGTIIPSSSPWAAPIVCVQKKDKSLRMCIDYRQLNAITTDDPYPLPRIEELLDSVATANYISTIDLSKGYYQIPISPKDQAKTAFVTPSGKFEFTKMPFGLKGAPATFQRTMDSLLQNHRSYASAYIDDIVTFSSSWKEHLTHLRNVLQELREAGFTVKKRKCAFARQEVTFLGHVVGAGKTRPQQAKLEAIKNFRKPQKKKDIRSFLGLVGYYRKFIPNFSTLAAPLSDLTGKKIPDKPNWTFVHQESFENLKKALTSDSILMTPDPHKEFTLQTDASTRGVGAVLSQRDSYGSLRPVAYYSRKLLDRETRYSITELECLAIVNAVKHFAIYLLGNHFHIETDHMALRYLSTMKNGGGRLTRWALALQPFTYSVEYRKGSSNSNADGLSRQAWDCKDPPGSTLPKGGGVSWTSIPDTEAPDNCSLRLAHMEA